MMKKLISLVLAAVMSVGMAATAVAADINVAVDGTSVAWTDAKPFIKDGRTLVPLRPIANALGLGVSWNAEAQQAGFSNGETTVVFGLNSKEYIVFQGEDLNAAEVVKMDTAAISENGRTYAPAKYLAQAFGYTVGWDQATQTVKITSGDAPAPAPAPAKQSLFDLAYVQVAPADLVGTAWNFTGAMIDGQDISDADYNALLESYGGSMGFVFDEGGVAYLVQGGTALPGTYKPHGSLYDVRFDFNGTELVYGCGFAEMVDGEIGMIAMTDATGENGFYFVQ